MAPRQPAGTHLNKNSVLFQVQRFVLVGFRRVQSHEKRLQTAEIQLSRAMLFHVLNTFDVHVNIARVQFDN